VQRCKNDYDKSKVIDHINGNKFNNNLSNLRLVNQSTNVKNAYINNDKMYQQNIIQAFDKNNILIKEFKNINEAREFINQKNSSGISNALRGTYKTAGNYIWKYKFKNIEKEIKNKYINDIKTFVPIGIINNDDYSNYMIDQNGIIINKNYNNRKIKNFLNNSGYKAVYLFNNEKKKTQYLLHRLISKCFLKNGDTYYNNKDYIVNHKDKNKLNNNIDNLEWITQKENIIHGCGRKIAKIDKDTNKVLKTYVSIADAYKELNIPRNPLISKVCNKEKGRKTVYGFKWEFVN